MIKIIKFNLTKCQIIFQTIDFQLAIINQKFIGVMIVLVFLESKILLLNLKQKILRKQMKMMIKKVKKESSELTFNEKN